MPNSYIDEVETGNLTMGNHVSNQSVEVEVMANTSQTVKYRQKTGFVSVGSVITKERWRYEQARYLIRQKCKK